MERLSHYPVPGASCKTLMLHVIAMGNGIEHAISACCLNCDIDQARLIRQLVACTVVFTADGLSTGAVSPGDEQCHDGGLGSPVPPAVTRAVLHHRVTRTQHR